jgi:hypothetical protein
MDEILCGVQRWRMTADQLRAAAWRPLNTVARDAMLELADAYDRLADNMEDAVIESRAKALRH